MMVPQQILLERWSTISGVKAARVDLITPM